MGLKIKRFHRSWYLEDSVYLIGEDHVKPEWMDLYLKFRRNRVWLHIVPDGEIEPDEQDRVRNLLETRVVNALENNCTGFWTAETDEKDSDGGLSLYFMFEHEEDMAHFLKNDGLMLRLEA